MNTYFNVTAKDIDAEKRARYENIVEIIKRIYIYYELLDYKLAPKDRMTNIKSIETQYESIIESEISKLNKFLEQIFIESKIKGKMKLWYFQSIINFKDKLPSVDELVLAILGNVTPSKK